MDCDKLVIEVDPKTRKKVINGEYRIIKKIGQGQYGKVLLGERVTNGNGKGSSGLVLSSAKKLLLSDGNTKLSSSSSNVSTSSSSSTSSVISTSQAQFVAIKTINRIDKAKLITKSYISNITKIKKEINILKQCNHPNVVKLYNVIDDLKFDKILLILEYCKFGEVDWKHYSHWYEKYSKHQHRLPLRLNKILRDIVNGLEYLHDYKHIIHRDLKPSNLLIDVNSTIKISDFGVSLILENNLNDSKELAKIMGTPAFYAPELCQFVKNRMSMITNKDHHLNRIKVDYRIDIWSLGVTMYCLMFNSLPFTGINEFDICKNIVDEELKFPKIKHTSRVTSDDIEELSQFKSLVKMMLVKKPSERITLQEVKADPFTTADLSPVESEKFKNFNKAIFKDAECKKNLDQSQNLENLENSKNLKNLKNLKNSKNSKKQQNLNDVSSLTGRIRKFFSKNAIDAPNSKAAFAKPSEQPAEDSDVHLVLAKNYDELEHVDDILDSYLDDSSSLSSIGSVENDEVDTSNILADLDLDLANNKDKNGLSVKVLDLENHQKSLDDPVRVSKHVPKPLNLPLAFSLPNSLPQSPNEKNDHYLNGLNPSTTIAASQTQDEILQATTLATKSNNIPTLASSSQTSTSTSTSTLTPVNDTFAVIGESSPVSNVQNNTTFSPSRRYFEQNKSKTNAYTGTTGQPSLRSLSSLGRDAENAKFELDMMEPPPSLLRLGAGNKDKVGSNSNYNYNYNYNHANNNNTNNNSNSNGNGNGNGNETKNNNSNSTDSGVGLERKGSSGSTGSNRKNSFGYGLTRIPSSLSSLNLNAYLTDGSDDISIRSNYSNSKSSMKKNKVKSKEEIKVQLAENVHKTDNEDENNEGDSTFTLANTSLGANYKDLSQYLDGLN